MAHDVACAIMESAQAMMTHDKDEQAKHFVEEALANHFNICIDKTFHMENADAGVGVSRYHYGCCSVYKVKGYVYLPVDDPYKPSRFVNITKPSDKGGNMIQMLTHLFTGYGCEHQPHKAICYRLSLSNPVYAKKKSGDRGDFKHWHTTIVFDYATDTTIEEMIQDAVNFILNIHTV